MGVTVQETNQIITVSENDIQVKVAAARPVTVAEITDASTGGKEVLEFSSELTDNTVPVAKADGGLEDSQITDDGTTVTIAGNLTVNGTTTTVNSSTVEVTDSLFHLAKDNTSTDTIDFGVYGSYNPGAGERFGAFFRDATDGVFKLYDTLTGEPTTTVDTGTGSLAPLALGKVDAGGTDTMTVNGSQVDSRIVGHVEDGDGYEAEKEVRRFSATAGTGAAMYYARARGTSASPTIVSSGDQLGNLSAVGYDGTDYALSAQITFEVDGTPGTDDMPGRIVFKTSPDGAQAPVEALRIAQDGLATFAGDIRVNGSTVASLPAGIDTSSNTDAGDVATEAKGTLLLSLESGGVQAIDKLGPSLIFSGINTARRRAMIASYQATSDADQVGLKFFVDSNTVGTNDAVTEALKIDHVGAATFAGRIITDDTTNATTTTDGSLQTDGGLSVVLDAVVGGTAQIDGNLTVGDGTGTIQVSINKNGANAGTLSFESDSVERFRWELNTAEDFICRAYDVAGVFIDSPIDIANASGGDVTINRPLVVNDSQTITDTATTGTGFQLTKDWAADNVLLNLRSDMTTSGIRGITFKSPSTDSSTDAFRISTANSFAFEIDSTDAMTITSAGDIDLANKLEVLNTTDATSATDDAASGHFDGGVSVTKTIYAGTGINLGDTTLSNYAEGTWTPTLTDGTNNATLSTADGRYTRIGRMVTVQFRIIATSLGSVAGTVYIGGLPFTVVNSVTNGAGSFSLTGGLSLGAAGYSLSLYPEPNDTRARLRTWDGTGGNTDTQATELTATTNLTGTITYEIA